MAPSSKDPIKSRMSRRDQHAKLSSITKGKSIHKKKANSVHIKLQPKRSRNKGALKNTSKHALKKLESILRKSKSDISGICKELEIQKTTSASPTSSKSENQGSKPSNKVGKTDSPKPEPSASKVKRRKRSRSSTRFTHIKISKPKMEAPNQPTGSGLRKSKSKLKVDLDDHSLSMLKALETPEHLAHVEACAKISSTGKVREIKNRLKSLLKKRVPGELTLPFKTDGYLKDHLESVRVLPPTTELKKANCSDTGYQIHVYQLNDDGAATDDWEEEDMATAKHWLLPNLEFDGVWENLIFDGPVKDTLLNYALTMLMYSDKNIDRNVISCNRVVLLHGPPGTGKTSLCKALAQKLCIRMSHKYRYGQLVEINSHGLFSKWFSESGKLVVKMFQKIQEYIDQKDTLVCILIDEVESLAAARKHMMHGNEPSDSMRVVNALLTQLDAVQKNPNVIVLTTSNVTGALELAFVDRADIKCYIGTPNPEAIYTIYRDCIHELMNKGIVHPTLTLLPKNHIDKKKCGADPCHKHSDRLWSLSRASDGLSGRSLRKIPFLAHANYVQSQTIDLNKFWDAMNKCIDNQHREKLHLSKDPEL